MMGTWYGLTWRRSPRQRRQKSFLLPLKHALVFPEEERVMQQSSVSIFLSFENQGINPVGDNTQVTWYLHKQSRTLQPTR